MSWALFRAWMWQVGGKAVAVYDYQLTMRRVTGSVAPGGVRKAGSGRGGKESGSEKEREEEEEEEEEGEGEKV